MRLLASLALLVTGCLSTPARPRQDASGAADATPDASSTAPAPAFVSRTGGPASGATASLAIPPPVNAAAGNLVVLYLDRFWANTALPAMNGWQTVAFLTFDADAPQIFYRVAASDEMSLTAEYTFPAGTLGSPPDASWALDVWRDASSAQMVFAMADSTATGMPAFPAAVAMPNEVVIDASVAAYQDTCSGPIGLDNRDLWSVLANTPGSVDALSFTCTPVQLFGRFQIRLVP